LKALIEIQKRSAVFAMKRLNPAQLAALTAVRKLAAQRGERLKQVKDIAQGLGSTKVAIPDNYEPPTLTKGVLTLNFGVNLVISEDTLIDPYDLACVTHSSEKTKLMTVLKAVESNINSGVFPFKDPSAIELSKNEHFINFWYNMREFCQQMTDGMIPKERALTLFFTHKWPVNSAVPFLIQQVNLTENAELTGVALFFDQLATWATSREKSRCECDDIQSLMKTGITPDLQQYPKMKRKATLIPALTKDVEQRCIERYPGLCTKIVKKPAAKTLENADTYVQEMLARITGVTVN